MNLNPYTTEIEDLQPGETIRANHGTNCSAGEDTRRRLYLTRVLANPDVVIGYCHNCNEGGKYMDKEYSQFRNERHGTPIANVSRSVTVNQVMEPKGLIRKLAQWPVHAQAWAMKNKLTQPDLDRYEIGHDPSTDRVYLPRYKDVLCNMTRAGRELKGYQLRLTYGKGPKYTTVRSEEDKGFTILKNNPSQDKDLIVVVEDLVSGIHIMNAMRNKVQCLVNYGVKINPLTIPCLNEFDKVVVWLDNDSSHVLEQAHKLARTISLYDKAETRVIDKLSDPKHFEKHEIIGALNGQH